MGEKPVIDMAVRKEADGSEVASVMGPWQALVKKGKERIARIREDRARRKEARAQWMQEFDLRTGVDDTRYTGDTLERAAENMEFMQRGDNPPGSRER